MPHQAMARQGSMVAAGEPWRSCQRGHAATSAPGTDAAHNRVQKARVPFHERHVITRRLGKGCFARVYAATRLVDGGYPQEVAVKVIDLRPAPGVAIPTPPVGAEGMGPVVDLRKWRQAEREAAILKMLAGTPHCIAFVDMLVESPYTYIVTERCELSLLKALETAPEITELFLKGLLRQMLEALRGIHAAGVVHRDIKPDNFLCTGRGRTVKLCDFGLADTVTHDRRELKGIYGTAPFMSPEMLAEQGYDTQTDVWSLAVVAYVLLVGQFPYRPLDRTSNGMRAAILKGLPEPSFKPKPELAARLPVQSPVSAGASSFLRSMLRRDPMERPTAELALTAEWLAAPTAADDLAAKVSLRPIFEAAKFMGAFTTFASEGVACALEVEMNALQAAYHRSHDTDSKSVSSGETASTKGYGGSSGTDSPSSSCVGQATPGPTPPPSPPSVPRAIKLCA